MALHGHTKIELRDARGVTQTVERDNFITNAVAEWLKPVGVFTTPYPYMASRAIEQLYGALVLFDKAVKGDENTFFPGSENHPVGYGDFDYVNTSEAGWLGSYNKAESFIDEKNNTATFVYDFATNQANGQIGAVCLAPSGVGVNAAFGMPGENFEGMTFTASGLYKVVDTACNQLKVNPFDASVEASAAKATDYTLLDYDFEGDCAWFYNNRTNTLSKWRMWTRSISLFKTLNTGWEKLSEQQVTYPEGLGNIVYEPDSNGRQIQMYDDTHFCVFYSRSENDTTGSVDYIYTMLVYELETAALTKTVSFTIHGSGAGEYLSLFCADGYILVMGGVDKKWFRVREDNPTDIEEPVYTQGYRPLDGKNRYVMQYKNGVAYIRTIYDTTVVADKDRDSCVWRVAENSVSMTNSCFGGPDRRAVGYNYRYDMGRMLRKSKLMRSVKNPTNEGFNLVDSGLQRLRLWLSTINNLGETVYKTADKTMKITYTLQLVEETEEPDAEEDVEEVLA